MERWLNSMIHVLQVILIAGVGFVLAGIHVTIIGVFSENESLMRFGLRALLSSLILTGIAFSIGIPINKEVRAEVLVDAKELFGEDVELVKDDIILRAVRVTHEEMTYKVVRKNNDIYYKEIQDITNEEVYDGRVIRGK